MQTLIKITTYFLTAGMLFCSCKKERPTDSYVSNSSQTVNDNTKVSISPEAISTWFATNKIGEKIIPDWTKAEKNIVGGVAVVKVPVKGFLNAATQQSNGKQITSLKTISNNTLKFDPVHPPMLYFLQDKHTGADTTLHPLLMNFIPDDPTKENGENKIWTGKLVEWNMQSDNALFQVLKKSYPIKLDRIDANETQTLNGVGAKVKVNTIFADIWDALKWFVEEIGLFFGVPGQYNYAAPGVTLTQCDFLWGIFCGSSPTDSHGDPGSGAGFYNSAGNYYNIIYSSYVPGYGGYDPVNTGWTNYSGGNGGGGGGGDPCPGQGTSGVNKNKTNQVGGGGGCPAAQDPIDVFAGYYGLSTTAASWLNYHPDAFSALNIYIDAQTTFSYQDKVDFLNFSVDYLMNHPGVDINVFANQFMTTPEGTDGPDNFNQSYWDDPNLQIAQQTLPSYQDFYNAFPNIDANAVYALVGGEILSHHQTNPRDYSNACALRVSRALNYSGITIPAVSGTEKGGDGKNYFLSAKNLNTYLKKAFGPPTYHFTKAQGGLKGGEFS